LRLELVGFGVQLRCVLQEPCPIGVLREGSGYAADPAREVTLFRRRCVMRHDSFLVVIVWAD
jgi:hypothetical protein